MSERSRGADVVLCIRCGGAVRSDPSLGTLACASCGASFAPPPASGAVPRHDVAAALGRAAAGALRDVAPQAHTVTCQTCGAVTTTCELATTCPFCAGALVVDDAPVAEHLPDAVAPFSVDGAAARAAARQRLARRLFAPSDLPRVLEGERLTAVYVPHWTFCATATAVYSGERGDASVRRTPRRGPDGRVELVPVRHVRWQRKHGHVRAELRDFPICASTSLPQELARALGPWPSAALVPFSPMHLHGLLAERYRIDLGSAYAMARAEVERELTKAARRDLGGDEQRIHHLSPKLDGATFRLVLLPLWISAYRYRGKLYHVAVNGQTGRVAAAAPWCKKKLAAAALALVAVAALVGWLVARRAPPPPEEPARLAAVGSARAG